jgi:hypothetical protein
MTYTAHKFPQAELKAYSKLLDLTSDTLKVILGNAAGPIDLSTAGIQACVTHADWKAIVAEITATGYTAGGATLASVSLSVTGDVLKLTCADPVWASSTITANQAMFYDATADVCLAFWDFGGAISSTVDNFTLHIPTNGIFTDTAS